MPAPVLAPPPVERPSPVMEGASIGRRTALALAVSFLAVISVPALHQLVVDLRETGGWRFLRVFSTPPDHDSLQAFGEALARDSALAAAARGWYQEALTAGLGLGSDKVIAGRDGFLFLRKEVDMASGPGFLSRKRAPARGADDAGRRNAGDSDPLEAILDFHRQLAARGVRLVVAPLPAKPFIYPERVWPGYPLAAGPAWNADRAPFLEKLAAAGVDAVDVTDALWRAKSEGRELFLRHDTHWTPAGLRVAAASLAARLRPLLGEVERKTYAPRPATAGAPGDLVRMLELPPGAAPFPLETVETVQALDGDRIARAGDEASVLLLGDSFTNVYSRKELEWGEGAGLAETLMLELGVPVQAIAINGGGATAVREALAAKPSALARKRVVVWAFSARDLADEDVAWERVPLPPVTAR